MPESRPRSRFRRPASDAGCVLLALLGTLVLAGCAGSQPPMAGRTTAIAGPITAGSTASSLDPSGGTRPPSGSRTPGSGPGTTGLSTAGTGRSTPAAGPRTPGTNPGTGTPTASQQPSGSPSRSPLPPTVPAGVPPCTGAHLSFGVIGIAVLDGTVNNAVQVTNTGATPCSLVGYPQVQVLDRRGRPLPTTTQHGAAAAGYHVPAGVPIAAPAQRVTLAPRGWAWFDVAFARGESRGCRGMHHGWGLAITAPGTTGSDAVPVLSEVPCGRLGVSAVLAPNLWQAKGWGPPLR